MEVGYRVCVCPVGKCVVTLPSLADMRVGREGWLEPGPLEAGSSKAEGRGEGGLGELSPGRVLCQLQGSGPWT